MLMRNRIILFFLLFSAAVYASAGRDTLRISGMSAFKELSRGEVLFPHKRHYGYGIGCLQCHHRYEKGENVLSVNELKPGSPAVSCVTCHTTGRDLQRAYHRFCITCHNEFKNNKAGSGPVMCGLCHSKKEKK
jgi:hypothetical protein